MRDIMSLDASKRHLLTAFQFLVTAVRILIGWHFLYEGISKLFAPNWTSTGYLLESHWLFSSFITGVSRTVRRVLVNLATIT